MLSTVYYYVSIQYYTSINDAEELKKLLFKMKIVDENEEYIYDIQFDEISKQVFLEVSSDGYTYLMSNTFATFDVKLQKVVFYLSPAYKFKR